MSTTFAAPARTSTAKPASTAGTSTRRSFTEQRRAARRAAADKSLRARLVRGRQLVDMVAASRKSDSRLPFVAVFALIAAVSVIALLMLNTATAQTSFTERKLNKELADLTITEQQLQQQVAAKQAPGELAKRAIELGMQPSSNPGNLVIDPDGTAHWTEPKPAPAPGGAPAGGAPAPAAPAQDGAAQQPPAAPQPPASQHGD